MNEMQILTQRKCRPCEGTGHPLDTQTADEYLKKIPGWEFTQNKKGISRLLVMKNFMAAIHLIHQIAALAEEENHHPDIHLVAYRKLTVALSTHAIGGLSENDFIMAAKINALPAELKK